MMIDFDFARRNDEIGAFARGSSGCRRRGCGGWETRGGV